MSSPGLSVVLLLSCCLHCFPMQGAGAAAAHDNNGSCQLYKLFGVYAGVFLRKRGTVRPFFIALSRPYPGSGVLLGRAVQALSGFARPAWPRCGQSGPCLGFVRMPWAFFPSLCLGLICVSCLSGLAALLSLSPPPCPDCFLALNAFLVISSCSPKNIVLCVYMTCCLQAAGGYRILIRYVSSNT